MRFARRPRWCLVFVVAALTATCTLDRAGGFDGSQFSSGGVPGDGAAEAAVGGAAGLGGTGGEGGVGAGGVSGGTGGVGGGGVGGTGDASGGAGGVGAGGAGGEPVDSGPDTNGVRLLETWDGRASYGLGGSVRARIQTWDDSLATWFVEPAQPDTPARINWIRHVLAPRPADVELLALASGTGSASSLALVRREGASGVLDLTISGVLDGAVVARGFDLELEAVSGDALLVYSDGTKTPVFRARSAGSWSAPLPLPLNDGVGPSPDVNTSPVHWIELEPREGGDVIALAYVDASGTLASIAWDGDAWVTSTAKSLSSQVKQNPRTGLVSNRAFDVAYESGGTLMVAWADAVGDGFYYETRAPGQSWSGTYVHVSGLSSAQFDFIDLASDPGSDRIAVALLDLGGPVERAAAATWTGTFWTDARVFDPQIRDVEDTAVGDMPGAVAWAGTTGNALMVYSDGTPGAIDWAKWTSATGWVAQSPVPVAGKGYTDSVVLRAFPSRAHVMAVLSDSASGLWAFRYDGVSWGQTVGGAPLDVGVSSLETVPFDFALIR